MGPWTVDSGSSQDDSLRSPRAGRQPVGGGASDPNPVAVGVGHHELAQALRMILQRAEPGNIPALSMLPQPARMRYQHEGLPNNR